MTGTEKKSGFACPSCGFFIEVTLESVFFEESQNCPSCLTKFSMDRRESTNALEQMDKLNAVIEDLDAKKKPKPDPPALGV